jgi:subtilisin family serine protease
MNRRTILWGVAALAISWHPASQAGSQDQSQFGTQRRNAQPSRVIIKFRPGIAANERAALHLAHGHQVEKTIPQLDMHAVRVPPGQTADDVIARYRKHPLVEFAEAETFMEPQLTPNDPWFPNWQLDLQQIGALAAWDVTTGSQGVPVAVLDTGLDIDHFEFADRIASGEIYGYDFADDDPDYDDPHGHGTWMAGIVGAMANNSLGIAGTTWQNQMVVLRTAFGLDTVEAITWATDSGVRVISMSYGGYTSTSWKEAAMQYAFDHGVVLVGAAGNDGTNQPFYPAAYPTVLAVTGVDWNGDPVGYNWGNWIDLSAPAGALTTYHTAYDSDGLGYAGGTSIATPFVASAAGLVLAVNPALTPTQVMDILRSTADDLGAPGCDELTGWGRVNLHAAVLAAANADPEPDTEAPSVAVIDPPTGEEVSGTITILAEAFDNIGVSRVDLLVDGGFVSSDTVSPHEWAFDTTDLADGPCTISAMAYDAAGNSAESALVQVTVDNSAPPPECLSNSECDDGLFCTGAETCDSNGVCQVGGEACPGQLCSESDDTCVDCLSNSQCDDGLFCNGAESCDGAGACQPGSDPCPGEDCDEATNVCVSAACDNDSTCEEGEDCNNCPGDCFSGSGASCGNGICEAADGEDCLSCPQDCNGKQGGKPSRRYCCGDGDGYNPVGCEDARCSQGEFACNAEPVADSCCGDGSCTGYEDGFTCELDCGPPPFCGDGVCNGDEDRCGCSGDCGQAPAQETNCGDGADEDCDGATDCNDAECTDDPACACLPAGAFCTANADCCSNKCRGNNTCGR